MATRIRAAAVLATFVASLVLPTFTASHAWGDLDLAGPQAGLIGANGRPALEPPHPAPAAEHCAICHWLRSLGQSSLAAIHPLPALVGLGRSVAPSTLSRIAVFAEGSPARAPPSSLLA